jgi:hypothetical protein
VEGTARSLEWFVGTVAVSPPGWSQGSVGNSLLSAHAAAAPAQGHALSESATRTCACMSLLLYVVIVASTQLHM